MKTHNIIWLTALVIGWLMYSVSPVSANGRVFVAISLTVIVGTVTSRLGIVRNNSDVLWKPSSVCIGALGTLLIVVMGGSDFFDISSSSVSQIAMILAICVAGGRGLFIQYGERSQNLVFQGALLLLATGLILCFLIVLYGASTPIISSFFLAGFPVFDSHSLVTVLFGMATFSGASFYLSGKFLKRSEGYAFFQGASVLSGFIPLALVTGIIPAICIVIFPFGFLVKYEQESGKPPNSMMYSSYMGTAVLSIFLLVSVRIAMQYLILPSGIFSILLILGAGLHLFSGYSPVPGTGSPSSCYKCGLEVAGDREEESND